MNQSPCSDAGGFFLLRKMKFTLNIPEGLSDKIQREPENYKFALTNNAEVSLFNNNVHTGYSWTIDAPIQPNVTQVQSFKIDEQEVTIKTITV